jgi:hypothetical protein
MAEGLVNMIEGGEPLNWVELIETNHHSSRQMK